MERGTPGARRREGTDWDPGSVLQPYLPLFFTAAGAQWLPGS